MQSKHGTAILLKVSPCSHECLKPKGMFLWSWTYSFLWKSPALYLWIKFSLLIYVWPCIGNNPLDQFSCGWLVCSLSFYSPLQRNCWVKYKLESQCWHPAWTLLVIDKDPILNHGIRPYKYSLDSFWAVLGVMTQWKLRSEYSTLLTGFCYATWHFRVRQICCPNLKKRGSVEALHQWTVISQARAEYTEFHQAKRKI